ncbi:rodlin [Streptomyces sp. DSM 44917]|uniref:Rodlin n=1 Tax=Streptomyces boetiae TaxID=3075541 RepID=A0ABU2LG61_9ACTN|nr:rodlin [Streptomyces sp. DSM 44917]MDT0310578.1 rodlin [Streptomyces sp. DSM 44917]
MIKKTLATVAVAAGVVGATGIAATPAMAISEDNVENTSFNGNGVKNVYGNTTTGGYMSPNISLINGSLNKPCIPIQEIDLSQLVNVINLVNVSVQDLLNSEPNAACSEGSVVVDGDDPLSSVLSNIPVLSQNGVNKS